MYIAGRIRTASSPSRTLILDASYADASEVRVIPDESFWLMCPLSPPPVPSPSPSGRVASRSCVEQRVSENPDRSCLHADPGDRRSEPSDDPVLRGRQQGLEASPA